jgi:hypothetical protein
MRPDGCPPLLGFPGRGVRVGSFGHVLLWLQVEGMRDGVGVGGGSVARSNAGSCEGGAAGRQLGSSTGKTTERPRRLLGSRVVCLREASPLVTHLSHGWASRRRAPLLARPARQVGEAYPCLMAKVRLQTSTHNPQSTTQPPPGSWPRMASMALWNTWPSAHAVTFFLDSSTALSLLLFLTTDCTMTDRALSATRRGTVLHISNIIRHHECSMYLLYVCSETTLIPSPRYMQHVIDEFAFWTIIISPYTPNAPTP